MDGTEIEFIGFFYTEVENRSYVFNEDLVKFQFLHIAKTGEWLSESEAATLMELAEAEKK